MPTQKHIAEKRFGETINSDVVLCKLCLPSVSSIKQLIWFLQKKLRVHNESAYLQTTICYIMYAYGCVCGCNLLHILLCLIKTWFLSSTLCKNIHPSLILMIAFTIGQCNPWAIKNVSNSGQTRKQNSLRRLIFSNCSLAYMKKEESKKE